MSEAPSIMFVLFKERWSSFLDKVNKNISRLRQVVGLMHCDCDWDPNFTCTDVFQTQTLSARSPARLSHTITSEAITYSNSKCFDQEILI